MAPPYTGLYKPDTLPVTFLTEKKSSAGYNTAILTKQIGFYHFFKTRQIHYIIKHIFLTSHISANLLISSTISPLYRGAVIFLMVMINTVL